MSIGLFPGSTGYRWLAPQRAAPIRRWWLDEIHHGEGDAAGEERRARQRQHRDEEDQCVAGQFRFVFKVAIDHQMVINWDWTRKLMEKIAATDENLTDRRVYVDIHDFDGQQFREATRFVDWSMECEEGAHKVLIAIKIYTKDGDKSLISMERPIKDAVAWINGIGR